MNAALRQDMALVQMYGKDELFSLPAWKVIHLFHASSLNNN